MPDQAAAMNTLPHPGAALVARAQAVDVTISAHHRVTVAEGADLFETVHSKLEELGAIGGAFTLISGNVSRLNLMTGGPGRDGLPMGFHGPFALSAPLSVVAGAAGSGLNEDGTRFTHCHACFRDRFGQLVGGHVILGETIAGEQGIVIDLFTIDGGRFKRQFDPETHFTIFHPEHA